MVASAFSRFWLIVERSHVGAERRHFQHTYSYVFSAHFRKISDQGNSMSGHQVMSSDLTSEKGWMLVIATPTDWSPWNFQRLISLIASIKQLSQNLDIGDPRSGQFCDLSIISQCEKNERHLFWTKTIWNTLEHRVTVIIDNLNHNIATSYPSSCRRGHFRSWKVISNFLPITFDRGRLERWKDHKCAQADDTNRLIYIMTFSDQVMTLSFGQVFKMTI